MKKLLIGALVAALAFSAFSLGVAVAGKHKTYKFGRAKAMGAAPAASLSTTVDHPKRIMIDMSAPPDDGLDLTYSLLCSWEGQEDVYTEGAEFHGEPGGDGTVTAGFVEGGEDVYADADSCVLQLDAASQGDGIINIVLRDPTIQG